MQLYDTQAEQELLGIVLAHPARALESSSGMITPEFFWSIKHKRIYRAIEELREDGQEADIVTVSEQLKEKNLLDDVGGRRYIAELASGAYGSPATIPFLEDKLVKFKKARELHDVAQNTITELEENPENAEALLEKLATASRTIRQSTWLEAIPLVEAYAPKPLTAD
ncbi:MAG: hypothetical protein K2X93_00055, partial [Candidatus Obscuribacterales bacterium]|nr:hypothetical protein [Candidatus Obscuribacterales bacterium]